MEELQKQDKVLKRKNIESPVMDPKRPRSDKESSDEDREDKPLCKYGEKCYQKNSYHLKKFKHPHRKTPVIEVHPKVETV